MKDTKEKLRLTCGVTQRIATDHVRVPSPMIGQYILDLRVNSIRDTGTPAGRASRLGEKRGVKSRLVMIQSNGLVINIDQIKIV